MRKLLTDLLEYKEMVKPSRLIIFFVPPEKIVNGGILSIFSICKVSREFADIHGAEVMLCTYPGTRSYGKNDLFANDEIIYSFDDIVARGTPQFLQLHVPEYASYDTCMKLKDYSKYLQSVNELRVNIMNQNILLMQPPQEVANWFALTPHVTQTTAHNKYSSQQIADDYDLPTLHLSTFVDQSQYKWVPYEQKKNIIALSPDKASAKDRIVAAIKRDLPDYEIVTIQNLRYEDYKELVANTKYVITFGEGFDGYYVEAFFSGGITFAVYNEKFFPSAEFAGFGNTFSSYQDMLGNITASIKKLDSDAAYQKVVTANLDKINELYSYQTYRGNIRKFYEGKFTYLPQRPSAELLLGQLIRERDALVGQLTKANDEKAAIIDCQGHELGLREKAISEREDRLQEAYAEIDRLVNSNSWKMTAPLRKASDKLHQHRHRK